MQRTEHQSPHSSRTVLSRRKPATVPHSVIIGSKQRYSHYARGSPSTHVVTRARGSPLPRAGPSPYEHIALHHRTQEVRTPVGMVALDNVFFRTIARVLVWMLLFQPVYVAMAVDLTEAGEGAQEALVLPKAGSEGMSDTSSTEGLSGESNEKNESREIQDEAPVSTVVASREGAENFEDVREDVIPPGQGETEETLATGGVSEGLETNASEIHEAVDESLESVKMQEPVLSEGGDGEGVIDTVIGEDEEDLLGGGESEGEAGSVETGANDTGAGVAGKEVGATGTGAPSEEETYEEDVTPVAEEAVVHTRASGDAYTFGKADCTIVADGEYYCISPTIQKYVAGEPRAYAEKDREGDMEIFYFDGTEVKRITNNSYDDFAPAFDAETKRIVWQANIGDRMRIMVHDVMKGETREITSGRQNASNPAILRDTVVWQEWVDTNWEIMMTNVNNKGAPFEIERLTDNVVHDMFPRVYNGMVTWQSERGSGWEVVVYNLHTGMRHNLEKKDTTKYENPRFVLLFDSKHDNGDVETIGYDLDTGEMMELGTRSNSIPFTPVTPKQEIPDVPVQTASTSMMLKVKADTDSGESEDDIPVLSLDGEASDLFLDEGEMDVFVEDQEMGGVEADAVEVPVEEGYVVTLR